MERVDLFTRRRIGRQNIHSRRSARGERPERRVRQVVTRGSVRGRRAWEGTDRGGDSIFYPSITRPRAKICHLTHMKCFADGAGRVRRERVVSLAHVVSVPVQTKEWDRGGEGSRMYAVEDQRKGRRGVRMPLFWSSSRATCRYLTSANSAQAGDTWSACATPALLKSPQSRLADRTQGRRFFPLSVSVRRRARLILLFPRLLMLNSGIDHGLPPRKVHLV
jgi:hypothetical protein